MYKQKGRNSKYPETIETWSIGQPVPEWLSDRAKVNGMYSEGQCTLEIRKTTSGGYELLDSGGQYTLVRVDTLNGVVCKDISSEKIISLRPEQLRLLYEKQ